MNAKGFHEMRRLDRKSARPIGSDRYGPTRIRDVVDRVGTALAVAQPHENRKDERMTDTQTNAAPLDGKLYLTDGGLETTLVFHNGIELPCFAVFDLVASAAGRATLTAYFERYIAIAREAGAGFILDTPTWRANPDWAAEIGYGPEELDRLTRAGVALARDIRAAQTSHLAPILVNGVVGPRGEAAPRYYMVNCAHPDHFADVLAEAGPRLRGIRANASRMSHAELDAAETLDIGDPQELGTLYRGLQQRYPQLAIFGGCCGTDERHIGAVCAACAPIAA